MSDLVSKLPHNLRKLMKRHKLSESSLSRQTDIPQPVISRLLSGSTTNPRVSTLLAIAKRFKISIESMVGYQDIPSEAAISNINYLYIHTNDTLLGSQEPSEMLLSEVSSEYNAYAYLVPHNLFEPHIPPGSHVIFSRNQQPINHALVLVKSGQNILMRRLLLLDTGDKILYLPAHPNCQYTLTENDEILGTALQIRVNESNEI